jgi:hypothetical protein
MATTREGVNLPAWSSRLIGEVNDADQFAQRLVAGLTIKQLNWQPGPGAWSVGQCLEHLALANNAYLAPISDALAGQPRHVVEEIRPGWCARWFISSAIEPSPRTRRVSAPKSIVPGSSGVDLAVLDRFVEGNRMFRDLIRRASDYDVNSIRFRNPFFPLLRFTVGSGLRIVAGHERRHLLQAERVKQAGGFPDR